MQIETPSPSPRPSGLKEIVAGPRGHFHLRVFRRGDLEYIEDRPNLIVNGSKFMLSRLLGGTVLNNSVSQIGFGTGSAAASAGNAALTDAYIKAIDSVVFPSSNQVQFNFSLASGESNGLGIWEFGLLSGATTLFNRVVRSSVLNKTSDITLSAYLLITF